MKHSTIVYDYYGIEKEISVETLVEDAITDCDTGGGVIEELQTKVDNLEAIVSRLLDVLVTRTYINMDDLAYMLKSYRSPDKVIDIRKENEK